MAKISYAEFKKKLMDPDVPDSEIAPYLTADREASGPFDPRIEPDPKKVEMGPEAQMDVESAIRWGNAICRWRRQQAFERRISSGVRKPVLVSEGDSWHQFPFLIEDVIDHLNLDFLIWSLDAAGDTADNMVNRNPEFMKALVEQKRNKVAGFLFSGAGNDVIGEDLLGNPVLGTLVKNFQRGKDAAWHVDKAKLSAVLSQLEKGYQKLVSTVRMDPDFKTLPIFFHGYGYAIPGGFPGDKRHPIYAKQDEWLGGPLKEKGIVDLKLQRDIVRVLIDALYDMLHSVAGNSKTSFVYVVDVRGELKEGDWADEIHATSDAFGRVAARFKKVINAAI
ncbi:hypothetical protein [Rhizobium mongolense]|uniref:SGNH hydrolase-type esterase domain-containing protein n=2 Tax=Rhizobium mongolense TaxID=57676 RepID=A0ABR6IZA1_9HYPH|nr:hypothetical protein [Rhizobium mongolense]MBB4233243.1 hypothetical protein [Rhizobium mongolense]TVZ74773.1 hypothetical protein BCL32_0085 [Rhizobium mongolense USDA 1844]